MSSAGSGFPASGFTFSLGECSGSEKSAGINVATGPQTNFSLMEQAGSPNRSEKPAPRHVTQTFEVSSAPAPAASVPALSLGSKRGATSLGAPHSGPLFTITETPTPPASSQLSASHDNRDISGKFKEITDDIGVGCKELSSMLDDCCKKVRERDELIRKESKSIDDVDIQLHKFKHYYDHLEAKIKKIEEDNVEHEKDLADLLRSADERASVCPTLCLNVEAKRKMQCAINEIRKRWHLQLAP